MASSPSASSAPPPSDVRPQEPSAHSSAANAITAIDRRGVTSRPPRYPRANPPPTLASGPTRGPGARGRLMRSRRVQASISAVVVLLIFGFLFPKIADYGEVWDTIRDMTGLELATLGLVAAWNLISYWPVLMAVQPDLRLKEAAVSNLSSTAV